MIDVFVIFNTYYPSVIQSPYVNNPGTAPPGGLHGKDSSSPSLPVDGEVLCEDVDTKYFTRCMPKA
jgi:hypothetical protein